MPQSDASKYINVSDAANCKTDGGVPIIASIVKIEDIEMAREYINYIDCSMMKEKLTRAPEQEGLGWSMEMADKVEVKYKKWLFLKRKYENEIIPPTHDIDAFWHAHILDTHAYFRDTAAIFGKYLHHYPYFGMRGKADEEKLTVAFENTRKLYQDEFGEDITD